MAQNRMTHQALIDQLQGADTDVLRRVLEHAMPRLIEAEAAMQIGAGPHERASTRTTYRNGYRERILDTGSGRLELQIPKLRTGSFFPTLLEPRRRIDRALLAVVQEAYVDGDRLGRALTTLVDGSALGEASWERGYQNHKAPVASGSSTIV